MQAYKQECVELLDRMCVESATKDGLLDYDGRCARGGDKLKVVDVYKGNVCCGEISKETVQQKSERLLRIAIKIAEVTVTTKEVRGVVEMAKNVKSSKTWRSVLRKLFGYVHSLLSFGIRRPVTLMIMTASILLVGYGITSTIVANLTNSAGAWKIGEGMYNVGGKAAEHATKTELTRVEMAQKKMMIEAAIPIVKGALGFVISGAAVGALPATSGVMAVGAAVGAMSDAQTVADASNAALAVVSQGTKAILREVGEQFVRFLLYSVSIE